jgi:hypothetical protein
MGSYNAKAQSAKDAVICLCRFFFPLDYYPRTFYFLYMGIIRLLKPGLFVYECVRILLLAFTLVFIMPEASAIPWLAFTASGALFPLMALFMWIDLDRYKTYLPLFIAGKCIGIFSLLCWTVVSGRLTMFEDFYGIYVIVDLVFLSGDLFALAAVLLLFRSMQKLTNKPAMVDTRVTEEEQCE